MMDCKKSEDGKSSGPGFLRSSFWALCTKAFTVLAGLMVSLMIGRTYGPEGTGLAAVAFATVTMINSITGIGVNRSLTVLYSKDGESKSELLGGAIVLWSLSGLISVILVSASYYLGIAQDVGWQILVPVLVAAPLLICTDYCNGILLAKLDMAAYNRTFVVRYLLQIASLVGFGLCLRLGLISITLSFLAGAVGSAASALVRLWREVAVRPRVSWGLIKGMLTLGVQYGLVAFVLAVNLRVNYIVLEATESLKIVGLFGMGVGMVEALWQIPTAVGTVLIGRSANARSVDEAVRLTTKSLRFMLPLLALSGLLVACFAEFLLKLFFGGRLETVSAGLVSSAVLCIRILVPGVICGLSYKILGADLAGRGKPLFALKAYGVASASNLIFSLLLVWQLKLGLVGAGIASSIGYALGGALFAGSYMKEYSLSFRDTFILSRQDVNFFFNRVKGRSSKSM